MKILSLRFKNLNSLYGEWLIDFTDSEYEANGIFALTGPTGAGKSTILDAICLALYGATPRLGRITQSANELMSRQTGECFAEVVFISQAGKYRCRWDQRRARKSPTGNLQHQEHQISEADTGKLIEDKRSRVGTVIEEKTGMDFERFTRSVLLAQGSFDTFLKADAEQKSKILEQITGTEIYTEISRRVHERLRNEKEILEVLETEIANVGLLNNEQEQAIQQDLVVKQQTYKALDETMAKLNQAQDWFKTKSQLRREIQALDEQEEALQKQLQDFAPERNRLRLATKAASLEGGYAALHAIRQQQKQDQTELTHRTQLLPQLEQTTQQQDQLLKSAQQRAENFKTQLQTARPLMQKIRLFDQQLLTQKKTLQQTKDQVEKITVLNEKHQVKCDAEQKKLSQTQSQYKACQSYLKNHQTDAALMSGLAAIEQLFSTLFYQQSEFTKKQKAYEENEIKKEQAEHAYHLSVEQHKQLYQELKQLTQQREQAQSTLDQMLEGRLLREFRADRDRLISEKFYLLKIAELTEQRTQLESGSPCPLCGAIEHPYADELPAPPSEIEKQIQKLEDLIHKMEQQQAFVSQLEKAEGQMQQQLRISENKKNSDQYALDLIKSTQTQWQLEINQRVTELAYLKQNLEQKLQPLGISEVPHQAESELLASLQTRKTEWQQQTERKTHLENEMIKLQSEINHLYSLLENQTQELKEQKNYFYTLENEYKAALAQRQQWYGDKNPDQEEQALTQVLMSAEKMQEQAYQKHNDLRQQLITATTYMTSLQQRLSQRLPQLKAAEAAFSQTLNQTGFVEEKTWKAARLSTEQQEVLMNQAKTLDDQELALKTHKKERQRRLDIEMAKQLTEKSVEQIASLRQEHEQSINELNTKLAELAYTLQQNAKAKEQIQSKKMQIEAQQKECQRWEKLHRLIGSADGKKYRNFAQGLTFELMVMHANRQLEKMTDRYLLMHDTTEPLNLNVVDNYQAGEIRSTKNLSGGESFIVSLSLALGLSKMASRKVRVDSLFLDEGFGTLDEDALDTALGTLSGLQQENKLIGVISHVPALKERIATQISVTPTHGGRSKIQGPGCARL